MGAVSVTLHREPDKKVLMLRAYASVGNVRQAAGQAEIARNTHYGWLRNDPDYKAGFEAAEQDYLNVLEAEVHRRGVLGIDKPLQHQGNLTGDTIKEYSDNLLMFATKKRDPGYRDTAPPNAGASITFNIIAPPGVDPTTIDAVVVKPELPDTTMHDGADDN